jgi:hypothetical protein
MYTKLLKSDEDFKQIELNTTFSCKKRTISLVPDTAGPQDKEAAEATNEHINQQRGYEMRAALVRVMKQEKKYGVNPLIAKASELLFSR